MMNNLKNRMYDHEEMPPLGTWERIAAELDKDEDNKVVYMPTETRKKPMFARMAVAASVLILILAGVFYMTNKDDTETEGANPQTLARTQAPVTTDKRYIIVTSPTGQKVKISAKFSNYIGSLYQDSPDNPDWYKKFSEWREIMQNQTLAPTTPNFLDVVEMSDFLEKAN